MIKQGYNTDGVEMRDWYVEHDPVDLACPDDSMTRQEFADECDINVLLAQYAKTGVFNHVNTKIPEYLDVSDVPDLMSSVRLFDEAQRQFMMLPAKVRREMNDDPEQFLAFASDPSNLPQMREWGLAAPLEPAGAVGVPPASPPAGSAVPPATPGPSTGGGASTPGGA